MTNVSVDVWLRGSDVATTEEENEAFRVVTKTVGAGQAMATANRDSFATQLMFEHEIGQALSHTSDTPCLLIDSRATPAFLNKQDYDNDLDKDPLTIDLNSNNDEHPIHIHVNDYVSSNNAPRRQNPRRASSQILTREPKVLWNAASGSLRKARCEAG